MEEICVILIQILKKLLVAAQALENKLLLALEAGNEAKALELAALLNNLAGDIKALAKLIETYCPDSLPE